MFTLGSGSDPIGDFPQAVHTSGPELRDSCSSLALSCLCGFPVLFECVLIGREVGRSAPPVPADLPVLACSMLPSHYAAYPLAVSSHAPHLFFPYCIRSVHRSVQKPQSNSAAIPCWPCAPTRTGRVIPLLLLLLLLPLLPVRRRRGRPPPPCPPPVAGMVTLGQVPPSKAAAATRPRRPPRGWRRHPFTPPAAAAAAATLAAVRPRLAPRSPQNPCRPRHLPLPPPPPPPPPPLIASPCFRWSTWAARPARHPRLRNRLLCPGQGTRPLECCTTRRWSGTVDQVRCSRV